jgi:hypothetical protein
VLNNSPYSVLFGNGPKLGLSSTSLHPSIFINITTEEELANKLDVLTTDALDMDSCTSDNDEDELNIVELRIDNESNVSHELNDDNQSNVTHELNDDNQLNITVQDRQNDEPLTSRVQRTNDIRETARKGQKRQANEFLQNTAKRHKLANFNVGDNVVSIIYSNNIY